MTDKKDKPKTKTILLNDGKWQGSLKTEAMVRSQIEKRWGSTEAKRYDPLKNCFTFQTWKNRGFQVKKGEHGLLSMTYIHKKTVDENDENKVVNTYSYPHKTIVFYDLQVQSMSK